MWLWTLPAQASPANEVSVVGAFEPAKTQIQTLVDENWGLWQKRFPAFGGAVPPLSFSDLPDDVHGRLAQSQGKNIELSKRIKRQDFNSVLRHELAHVFINNACGDIPFPVAEGGALWLAGDYLRLSYNSQFKYENEAQFWLEKEGWLAKEPSQTMEWALARLMSAPGKETQWNNFFSHLMESCEKKQVGTSLKRDLAELLKHESTDGKARVDFLLMDGLSHEKISTEGRLKEKFPVGSLLKPLLVATMKTYQIPRDSRAAPEWACPHPSLKSVSWNWPEALAKSCNGYFLDGHPGSEDWAAWQNLEGSLKWRRSSSHMLEILGFVGSFGLDLEEVTRSYEWLNLVSPQVAEALRETPKNGTLSKNINSQWFINRGIALKSGTVRDVDNTPAHAWIAALGPRALSGNPSFIAVIHGERLGREFLLKELARRLKEKLPSLLKPAHIQILGLAPLNRLQFSCSNSVLMKKTKVGNWVSSSVITIKGSELKDGDSYNCLTGPLKFEIPKKGSQTFARNYWGTLHVKDFRGSQDAEPSMVTERQARARRGSPLILETSQRHYVASVLASEFPEGRSQTLKALAVAVYNNLNYQRHGDRPLCDTTHCQVFENGQMEGKLWRRLISLVDSIPLRYFEKTGRRWMPFSLGGESPWVSTRPDSLLRARLEWAGELKKISREEEKIQIFGSQGLLAQLPCEKFRERLALRACPTEFSQSGGVWRLSGSGEGHGQGLNLIKADLLAAQGESFENLLARYFP